MCGNSLPHCQCVQGVRTTRRHNVRKGFFFYDASRRSMEIARSFELCNDNEILLLRCCCAASASAAVLLLPCCHIACDVDAPVVTLLKFLLYFIVFLFCLLLFLLIFWGSSNARWQHAHLSNNYEFLCTHTHSPTHLPYWLLQMLLYFTYPLV